MHGQSLICIEGGLQCTANFANFHILVFRNKSIVDQSFELGLLLFEFLDLFQNSFSLFDLTVLSKTFSLLVKELNLLVKLINFLMDSLLLNLVHLGCSFDLLSDSAHGSVFSSLQRPFDFLVHLTDHEFQLLDQLFLVTALESGVLCVSHVLILQKVVMSLFAWSDVCLCVREQIIGTERQKIELANLKSGSLKYAFAYILVVKMVSLCYPNEKRFVAIFTHQLVEFLLNEVHFKFINIKLNSFNSNTDFHPLRCCLPK